MCFPPLIYSEAAFVLIFKSLVPSSPIDAWWANIYAGEQKVAMPIDTELIFGFFRKLPPIRNNRTKDMQNIWAGIIFKSSEWPLVCW